MYTCRKVGYIETALKEAPCIYV